MKKIILGTILSLILVGCNNTKPNYAIISGKATNSSDQYLRLLNNGSFVGEVIFAPDGTFRDTIRDLKNNHFLLLDSEQKNGIPIYLEAGSELVINYDTNISNAVVTGEGAEVTKFLLEKEKFLSPKLGRELFTKNATEFKQEINKVFAEYDKKLEQAELNKNFTEREKRWATYTRVLYLDQYPAMFRMLTKSEQETQVPADFNPEKATLDYDNATDYESITNYRQLVQNHYLTMIKDPNNTQEVTEFINTVKNLKAENIKKDISEALVSLMSPKNPNNELIYNYISQNIVKEEVKQNAKIVFETSQKLSLGAVAPSFECESIDGKRIKLEDLRKKVLYIDLWATWCRPCLKEIPHLKELEKEFHNTNIEFVSISIDQPEDKEKWKNFVKKESLKGIQLIVDNGRDTKFLDEYLVTGIPRFILIDGEGKIIDINAPRPSEPQTREILKQYLK